MLFSSGPQTCIRRLQACTAIAGPGHVLVLMLTFAAAGASLSLVASPSVVASQATLSYTPCKRPGRRAGVVVWGHSN